MSHTALPAPSTRNLAWYFVVTIGPNTGTVVGGPFPEEPDRWVRKQVEDECEADVAAELLTPSEAERMGL